MIIILVHHSSRQAKKWAAAIEAEVAEFKEDITVTNK